VPGAEPVVRGRRRIRPSAEEPVASPPAPAVVTLGRGAGGPRRRADRGNLSRSGRARPWAEASRRPARGRWGRPCPRLSSRASRTCSPPAVRTTRAGALLPWPRPVVLGRCCNRIAVVSRCRRAGLVGRPVDSRRAWRHHHL